MLVCPPDSSGSTPKATQRALFNQENTNKKIHKRMKLMNKEEEGRRRVMVGNTNLNALDTCMKISKIKFNNNKSNC